MKTRFYAKRYGIIFIVLLLLISNSCRKFNGDIDPDAGNTTAITETIQQKLDKLSSEQKITPQEISDWRATLPSNFTLPVKWDKARQNVINGQHVIGIPINFGSSIFLTKVKGEFQAFTYAWSNKSTDSSKYTGNITSFSFQDYSMRFMEYRDDELVGIGLPKVVTIPYGTAVTAPAQAGQGKQTTSFLSNIWHAIVQAIEQLVCFVIGGHYGIDGANGLMEFPCSNVGSYVWVTEGLSAIGNAFFGTGGSAAGTGNGGDAGSSDNSIYYFTGDGSLWVKQWVENTPGDCPTAPQPVATSIKKPFKLDPNSPGCNGGGRWVEYLAMPPDHSIMLIETLHITNPSKIAFLQSNPALVKELSIYLKTHVYSQETIDFLNLALDNLMADPAYASFVNNHATTSPSNTVWWEDDDWLDYKNFNLSTMSQDDPYKRINAEEKRTLRYYPYEGYLISKNKPIAENKTKQIFGRSGLNDKSDAFRHAFFNAMNERDCGKSLLGLGPSIAKMFSDAHEADTDPSLILEKEMDIFNNTQGQTVPYIPNIARDNDTYANIINHMLSMGELRYLSPLDPTHFRGIIWGVTKLTPTNQ